MKGKILDKVWIPLKAIPKDQHTEIDEAYTDRLYNEKGCRRCEFKADRHTEECDSCPNFTGAFKAYNLRTSKSGTKYIGLPLGNRTLLNHFKPDIEYVDGRVTTPFKYPIRFTQNLYEHQQEPCDTVVKKKHGVLLAPPRSGKTPMSIYIATKIGYKTLIIANQHEYLAQFLETIYGEEKAGVPQFTNVERLEKKHGVKIAGFAKKYEDFEKYDIAVCTYQMFLSEKGQSLLKRVSNLFGTVILDEAHKAGAECFLRVMGKFKARCRIGLTGTYDRKDGKHVLIKKIMGPVIANVKIEMLLPRVEVHHTGVEIKKARHFVTNMKRIVNDKKRIKMLVRMVVQDIKSGRSVVIPVPYVDTAKEIVKKVQEELPHNMVDCCAVFTAATGKEGRKKIIEDARSGKVKLVVGIRQMIQTGLNIPRWDTLYVYTPISNPPNFTQETSRIRTPMDNKPQPVIKFFVEDNDITRGCFKTSWNETVIPSNFIVSAETALVANGFMSKTQKRSVFGNSSYVSRSNVKLSPF